MHYHFTGASDHGVSEALYLNDPDGNGIELYWDRPKEVWPQKNGSLDMYTRPLSLNDLLKELKTKQGVGSGGSGSARSYRLPQNRIGRQNLKVTEGRQKNGIVHYLFIFDYSIFIT